MASTIRMFSTLALLACVLGAAVAGPQKPAFWTGTPMDNAVEQMRSNCDSGADSLACMKFQVASFLDSVLTQDSFKMFGDVEVRSNGFASESSGARAATGDAGLVEAMEKYVESHDVTINVPAVGAKVTVSPKNLEADELNVSIKFAPEGRSAVEGKHDEFTEPV